MTRTVRTTALWALAGMLVQSATVGNAHGYGKNRLLVDIEPISVGRLDSSAYTPYSAGDFLPAGEFVFGIQNIPSYGVAGNPNNARFVLHVGEGEYEWLGMGWDVTLEAFAPSFLSEMSILILNVNGDGYRFRVSGELRPGVGRYTSEGIYDLETRYRLPRLRLPDGRLYLEFAETFDNPFTAPDGIWRSGSLTFRVVPAPPFLGWEEQQDAGDLPETAQSLPARAIPAIRGRLEEADVDMFALYIADPSEFSATTILGAAFDTQLWLFDAEGRGIAYSDDFDNSFQSTLTGNCVPDPGVYYLAISRYPRYPVGCQERFLWFLEAQLSCQPNGVDASSRIVAWRERTPRSSEYLIFLTGAQGASTGDPADCAEIPPWRESYHGGQDAGNLPSNAQPVSLPDRTSCETPLETVRGELSDSNDVDMYVICITDPSRFIAHTRYESNEFDAQLWLFRCDGTGVVHNDVYDPQFGARPAQIRSNPNCPIQPGTYLLAISAYNNDPIDAEGEPLWSDANPTLNLCPDGPGAANPVAGWTGTTSQERGSYLIALRGASFVAPSGCQQCPGDVNQDRIVDDSDLLLVLFAFGAAGSGRAEDVNRDGIVDDADLLIVLFNFGQTC